MLVQLSSDEVLSVDSLLSSGHNQVSGKVLGVMMMMVMMIMMG